MTSYLFLFFVNMSIALTGKYLVLLDEKGRLLDDEFLNINFALFDGAGTRVIVGMDR